MENQTNCQPSCCCPSSQQIFTMYENAAELHNESLMYIATLPNYLDLDFKQAFDTSTEFCKNAFPTINVESIISFDDAEAAYKKIVESSVDNNYAEFANFLYAQGFLTVNQAQYYKLIINTILAKQNEKPILVVAAMKGLQNSLLSRNDIPATELPIMYAMSTASVAVVQFWATTFDDKKSAWHDAVSGGATFRWFGKALRDLGGFIVGALVGTAIGGPAVGAAGGTLVGGAASSSK